MNKAVWPYSLSPLIIPFGFFRLLLFPFVVAFESAEVLCVLITFLA